MLGRVGTALQRLYEPESETALRMGRVPDAIQDKLAHLEERASVAMSVLREVGQRHREADEELRDATTKLEECRPAKEEATRRGRIAQRSPDGYIIEREDSWKFDENVRIALEAQRVRASRAIERLAPRLAEVSEHSDACGRLTRACTQWAKERDPEALTEALTRAAGVPAARVAVAHLPDELAKVRATLGTLATERAAVTAAGVPLEEARSRVAAYVDRIASGYVPDPGWFLQNDYAPGPQPEYYGAGAVPQDQDTAGMRAFVVFLLADPIKAALEEPLKRAAEAKGLLLSPAERPRRLAGLDGKIYAAGVREESLVLQCEAAALAVARREAADPACVLTVTLEDAVG